MCGEAETLWARLAINKYLLATKTDCEVEDWQVDYKEVNIYRDFKISRIFFLLFYSHLVKLNGYL